jgi:4-hydroxy-tetrahydrodipicolinate synthase
VSLAPKGIIVPIITPLTETGKMKRETMRELIEHLIKGGVHGLFATGSTGEFYGLSNAEKRKIFEFVVEAADGRLPVYAGTGAITTRESVELTEMAEACGVDAVSVLTPMFINPSQEELYEHYRSIASCTRLPLLLYSNPPRTGVNLKPETVARLAEIDNIVGIKDSSGDLTIAGEYIRLTKGRDFHILSRRDTLIYACLCHGGSGAVSACANVAPRLVVDIYRLYTSGDLQGALEAQQRLAPLRLAFKLGTFPVVIKEALELIGIDAGRALAPVGSLSPERRTQLKRILDLLEGFR